MPDTVNFTPERLQALKDAYMQAVKEGAKEFRLPFCDGPILIDYAKYLIEYLDPILGKKGT